MGVETGQARGPAPTDAVYNSGVTTDLITQIASDEVLENAFIWLCRQREDLSPNNDVWNLRADWADAKPALQQELLSGEYCFTAQSELRFPDNIIEYWAARDSLVLKAMSIVLGEYLGPVISPRCFHTAGNGGLKGAVREVRDRLNKDDFIMKSDVRGYYANIDHHILFDQLSELIDDRFVLRLLWGDLKRTVCYGGLYREVERGISLGCPLSPLMGALYLRPLDKAMEESGLFYARYMDDWIVIAPSRWKLRKAVATENRVLDVLLVEQHPDKTFIGRAERGFDFLGYRFTPDGLGVAEKTVERFVERATRLYEQEPGEPCGSSRFGEYVKRWFCWVRAGLGDEAVSTLNMPWRAVAPAFPLLA